LENEVELGRFRKPSEVLMAGKKYSYMLGDS